MHAKAKLKLLIYSQAEAAAWPAGERSLATLGVAVAVRHLTHLHQASGLLAAVPVPPATAGNAPQNMVGATGRGTLADLFLLTPTVFGLCSVGEQPAC